MFPEFIPKDLKIFWLFFICLSFAPLIAAIISQRKADKDEKEKNK